MAAQPAEPDPLAVRLLYSPHDPEPPQAAFLLLDDIGVLEALYGGAGGGGKSDALLMSALRYVDVPGYAALLLRRTYQDLALPGALMDRAHRWLQATDAKWSATDFRWTFPSTATLSFGYLQYANDKYRYASAEFQFIGFDELTQFRADDYRFLFTRLRKPDLPPDAPAHIRAERELLAQVPLRIRTASNPGGSGHEWVKDRFLLKRTDPDDPEDTPERAARRIFIPARLEDNPHVNQAAYRESLAHVDPVVRAQILEGNWDVDLGDRVFPGRDLTNAERLGAELDNLLATGRMPPPAGDLLAIGLDWGEHSAWAIGWPLEGGGLYIAAAREVLGIEVTQTAGKILEDLDLIVRLGRQRPPRPQGRRPEPPAIPDDRRHPLLLVREHRYDAAGVQSMRTYLRYMRRIHPNARSLKVAFGAPSPRSGTTAKPRSYKAEAINYIRRLLLRSTYGPAMADPDFDILDLPPAPSPPNDNYAGALAISPARAELLLRQARGLEWADRDQGIVRKGDDHTVDAAISLVAPLAVAHR